MALSQPEEFFQEELTCPVCLQTLVDPASLPCGHSFCFTCIQAVVESKKVGGAGAAGEDGKAHSCPECRSKHSGLGALQRNVKLCNIVDRFRAADRRPGSTAVLCDMCLDGPTSALKTCLKCEISMCAAHLQPHLSTPALIRTHPLAEPTAARDLASRKCPEHGKLLEYYCYADRACACVSCAIEGPHRQHNMRSFPTARKELVKGLEGDLQEVSAKLQRSKELLAAETTRQEAARAAGAELQQKAEAQLEEAMQAAARYKAQVLGILVGEQQRQDAAFQDELRALTARAEELRGAQSAGQEALAEEEPFLFIQKFLAAERAVAAAKVMRLCQPAAHRLDTAKLVKELEGGCTQAQGELTRGLRALLTLVNPASPGGGVPAQLTFDKQTLGPDMRLSPNLKTLYHTSLNRKKALKIRRHPVLCTQSFSTGMHHWQVEVPTACGWTVGVTSKQQTDFTTNSRMELGLQCIGSQLYSVRPECMTPILGRASPSKLGVCLDTSRAALSFYDETNSQSKRELCTLQVGLSGPLFPFVTPQPDSQNCYDSGNPYCASTVETVLFTLTS
nr:PREDICTED: zinc-binding protein A33-like [Lepisosteus oculatus]